MNILVTGGCGFIGSHFIINQIKDGNFIINLDKLTYAANKNNLSSIENNKNYVFIKGDINDQNLIQKILEKYKINWLVNFAAESHVDNSINAPKEFINTNINGTFNLLNCSLQYWQKLSQTNREIFRFLHISTDEVYGSLKPEEPQFKETNQYKPNSPYSASKAAADHIVRAWNKTYDLPTITTNCSNNFGPHQHQEKLIPTIINSCLNNKEIPIYGNGKNIRDWIYVLDHCHGINLALQKGTIGETYCLGGNKELTNIDLTNYICENLDKIRPRKDGTSYKKLISFIKDRAGHDKRYAISNSKSEKELNFKPNDNFDKNISDTIKYYLDINK